MSEINKTYRIRTDIGKKLTDKYITLDANLVQDYDTFDILSVKINSVDTYKLHNANYGVVVGRVLANNGFGIPNAKLSIFIESDTEDGAKIRELYPFSTTASKNRKGVRYNLLPDEKVNDCHQIVGTFPNKRFALDNDVVLEVFDKYYKYTTRTNNAGDYLIMGVPVGAHTLHMDLDLSDCGILSQKPRDFVYKGYTVEQFENPNMFKDGTSYSNLSQIFTQNQVVNVQPFWGNSSLGEKIGITRADIDVAFKFEPTCVFIGSVISDNSSQGISKKCVPTENMGNMEELTTGEGTIEMIRKTPGGSVEEFQVKGTQLIDGNGIWCYQIPMNLDYMMTDEYGNMVPTDDPEKGIPTRTKVRFRVSMQDNEENVDNYFRAKVLVPHNPQNLDNGKHEEYDYEFGSLTKDESFRDLFWNNVYSVKSYIPRFQKRKVGGWKEKKFTGIKNCNFYGSNNPMPYNNIRIKLPFMFTVMCALIKVFIFIVSIMNSLTSMLGNFLCDLGDTYIGFRIGKWNIGFYPFKNLYKQSLSLSMNVIKEGLCPDLENWYFAPMFRNNLWSSSKKPPKDMPKYDLLKQTLEKIRDASADDDVESIDYQNNEEMENGDEPVCLTIHTDYLISCVEMNLAMEYKVINFDFYNDWVNGTLYFPRFMRYVRPKKTFLGITFLRSKVKGCMDDTKIFSKTRRYTQQCALGFKNQSVNGAGVYTNVENPLAKKKNITAANNLHRQRGLTQKTIFGKNGGVCHEHTTLRGQYVYYMKPCEWTYNTTPNARKVNLFATDIILLGSLNDCDLNGVPQAFKYLSSSSYVMPTNLALTNMENSSYLYVTDNGSICAGKSQLEATDIKNQSRIRVASPNSGLTAEIMAFSGAQDSNYNVLYDGNELSDVIALTEAAGISWNYTGPGQGEMDSQRFYYPGGHFLGLSCVNSQTNIKSCINLSRICEIGANMSQRKEDISSIDENGNAVYTYTAPTGFISGDDIVGSNFRTMFATMNYKRLIATKTNPFTGYKMYDFQYVKPINFDGSFKSVTSHSKSSSLYNGKITPPEENKSIWQKIGIDFNADSRPDYDENENINTQTRTIEDTSVDYYLYRLGLDYDNLKKSNQKQIRRFLVSDGNKMYLPQYENSYYFYFGLKNGATAIDEFNKQFFSECANGMLLANEPVVDISIIGDINICEGVANVNVVTSNLEIPFQTIEIVSDVKFNGKNKYLLIKNGDDETEYDSWLTNYMFSLSGCEFGTYTITIRDANDVVYSKTEKIGVDILSFESNVYDFNTTSGDTSLLHRGGYISVSNITIDGLEEGHIITAYTPTASETFANGEKTTKDLKVDGAGVYELRIKYKCKDASKPVDILLQTFTVKDNKDLKLFIGDASIRKNEMTHTSHPYGWWSASTLNYNSKWIERISTFNEVLPEKRRTEASGIKVYSEGGVKAVWGCPQNSEKGIKTDSVWSSEDTSSWVDGYTMDDEYVHYPTYKYNNTEVKHFSALVYNGTMVMGHYESKMSNGVISPTTSSKLKNGCGYIFKPLPEGDLQFHVYNGSYTATTKDENGGTITDGVFYPSISYPSIDRPFYAETNFFCWHRRAIEMIPDENGETTPTIVDYEDGSRTEMKVHNGVTYNNHYLLPFNDDDTKSFISNLPDCTFYVEDNSDIKGVKDSNNRTTIFTGYSNGVKTEDVPVSDSPYGAKYSYIFSGTSGVGTYSYEIIEGAPTEKDSALSNSLYDNVESLFANYVRFAVDGTQIIGPVGEGGSGVGNADYYMVSAKSESNAFIVQNDTRYQYISSKNRKVHYILCSYTNISPLTDYVGTFDDEGAPVLVRVETDDRIPNELGNRPDKIWVSYKCKNENGDMVTWNSGKIKFKKSEKTKHIIELFETVFDYCSGITGIVDYRINSDKKDWADILSKNKLSSNHVYNSSTVYYAYGVITNPETKTKLYKIYPTPIKVSEIAEPDFSPIKIDQVTGEIICEFGVNGGRKEMTLIGSVTQMWTSSNNANWCRITPTSGLKENKITLTVDKNNNTADRSATIYLYYNGETQKDSETKIIVKQAAKEPITEASYTIKDASLTSMSLTDNLTEMSLMLVTDKFKITVDSGKTYKIQLPTLKASNVRGATVSNAEIRILDADGRVGDRDKTYTIPILFKSVNEGYNLGTITTSMLTSGDYQIRFTGTIKANNKPEDAITYTLSGGTYNITMSN